MLTVVGFWWSDPARQRSYSFGIEHVVVWRNMIERHLSIPHRLAVVTDDLHAVENAGIEAVPIDMAKHVPGTVFVRLMLRRPDIGKILGDRILSLDLDCVIVDSLDPIVARTEPCIWWRNPNFNTASASRAFYQTSVQLFDAGTHPELWRDFDPKRTPQWVNRRFGGHEQAWVSERVSWDEPHFSDADGIYGAGRLFHGKADRGVQSELPPNARIVSVPGNRAPWQKETQEAHPWMAEHYR